VNVGRVEKSRICAELGRIYIFLNG